MADVDDSTAGAGDDFVAWLHRLKVAGIRPEEVEFETTAEGMELVLAEIGTLMTCLGDAIACARSDGGPSYGP